MVGLLHCFQQHRSFQKISLYFQQDRGSYVQLTVSKWLSPGSGAFQPAWSSGSCVSDLLRCVAATLRSLSLRWGGRRLQPVPLASPRRTFGVRQPSFRSKALEMALRRSSAGTNPTQCWMTTPLRSIRNSVGKIEMLPYAESLSFV